jgi:hypothetical protein
MRMDDHHGSFAPTVNDAILTMAARTYCRKFVIIREGCRRADFRTLPETTAAAGMELRRGERGVRTEAA